jgi:hypothetical protein
MIDYVAIYLEDLQFSNKFLNLGFGRGSVSSGVQPTLPVEQQG